ncbi:hypothetical protein C1646_761267 [Rhizophagus diaphanus]|nr:hypothetical protein C1646_761267 [Rhizophagus diaphanus] [Rhizophagus sp. MUCL 43196]
MNDTRYGTFPLKVYLQTGGSQDVLIQAGKNSDYKELYAHSLILGCRSQYFRDAFPINSIEKIDGKYIIKRPDISPRSFRTVILDREDGVEVLNLFMASNELELHKLKNHVGNFLKKHQRYFFQKHPIDMIDIIFTHDIFADLREFCLETLCAEPHILLEKIEISIWDDILVWGFAKNPSLDNDEQDLLWHSVPNLTAQVNGPIRRATLPKIDSKIITTQHVLSFSSWIDGFEYKNAKIIPYDFNLLLRGSHDAPNIGRVKPNECSVRCYKEWGANYEGGNDLAMKNKAEWKSKLVSYPDIKIPKKFICSGY